MTTELNDEIPNTKKELKIRVDILNESMVKMRERLEEIEEENKTLKKRQGKRNTELQLRVEKIIIKYSQNFENIILYAKQIINYTILMYYGDTFFQHFHVLMFMFNC